MASRVQTELYPARGPMSDIVKTLWQGVNCPAGTTISNCQPQQVAMDNIAKLINSDETIRTHVHDLLNVYYDISTCGISGQCDKTVLCNAFFPEISGFYAKYFGYLKYFDDNWNIGKIPQIGKFLDMCEPEMRD